MLVIGASCLALWSAGCAMGLTTDDPDVAVGDETSADDVVAHDQGSADARPDSALDGSTAHDAAMDARADAGVDARADAGPDVPVTRDVPVTPDVATMPDVTVTPDVPVLPDVMVTPDVPVMTGPPDAGGICVQNSDCNYTGGCCFLFGLPVGTCGCLAPPFNICTPGC